MKLTPFLCFLVCVDGKPSGVALGAPAPDIPQTSNTTTLVAEEIALQGSLGNYQTGQPVNIAPTPSDVLNSSDNHGDKGEAEATFQPNVTEASTMNSSLNTSQYPRLHKIKSSEHTAEKWLVALVGMAIVLAITGYDLFEFLRDDD